MARKDFDDLLLVIRSNITDDAVAAVISNEVDLNLPRGFIAKIKKVIFEANDLAPELLDVVATSILQAMALIRDPDDTVSTGMPSNTDEHDVIAEWNFSAIGNTTGNLIQMPGGQLRVEIDFSEADEDVITARNLRFNISGSATANFTPTYNCKVYYTLEPVTDDLILNLLDIL